MAIVRLFTGADDRSHMEELDLDSNPDLASMHGAEGEMTKELDTGFGVAPKVFPVPAFYNLHLDPREEYPILNAPENFWVRYPAGQALLEHLGTLQKEPPIKPFTPDPYVPGNP